MKLIIDNNILFSLMKLDSSASLIFEKYKIEFLAPEFIKKELEEHESECLKKSGLSKSEFKKRREQIESKIRFIDFFHFKNFLKQAEEISVDIDDSPYLALALSLSCPIWSNDHDLKNQSIIEILNTKELVSLLA